MGKIEKGTGTGTGTKGNGGKAGEKENFRSIGGGGLRGGLVLIAGCLS